MIVQQDIDRHGNANVISV